MDTGQLVARLAWIAVGLGYAAEVWKLARVGWGPRRGRPRA
jgi:hypothetical protein